MCVGGGGYIGYIIKTWLEHTFAALLTDGMIRVLCTKHFSPQKNNQSVLISSNNIIRNDNDVLIETDRDRDRQTGTDKDRDRLTNRQTNRDRDRLTDRDRKRGSEFCYCCFYDNNFIQIKNTEAVVGAEGC